MKHLSAALRESRSEANQLAYQEQQFNAKVMYRDLVHLSTEEDRIAASHVPTSVRALAKSHKVQRGLEGRDNLVQAFFSIAHRDNKRLAQKDKYIAYREAKKQAARIS